jgi:hypothetical protein
LAIEHHVDKYSAFWKKIPPIIMNITYLQEKAKKTRAPRANAKVTNSHIEDINAIMTAKK